MQFLVALPGFAAGGYVIFQRVRLAATGRPSNVMRALKLTGLSFLAWGLVLVIALWW